MQKLSFILPCYNAEKFIGTCLDSLLNQDIPHDKYELICINDCSTDNTEKIIKNYAELYGNIRLFTNEINLGVGKTRNVGLSKVRGKYFWFVDSDDMIKPNVLKYLLSICEEQNLDVLFFNYEEINEDERLRHTVNNFIDSEICTGYQFVEKYFNNKLSKLSILWHQIYRTQYINENSLEVPELLSSEDATFAWDSLLKAARTKSISIPIYIYRYNANSLTAREKKINGELLFHKSILFGNEILKLKEKFSDNVLVYNELVDTATWAINSFSHLIVIAERNDIIIFKNCFLKNKQNLSQIHSFLTKKSARILKMSSFNNILFLIYIKLELLRKKISIKK